MRHKPSRPALVSVVSVCALAAPAAVIACAVGADRQEFGDNFTDAGATRDAIAFVDGASDAQAPPPDGAPPPADATPPPLDAGRDQAAPPPDAAGDAAPPCTGQIAVVAGDDTKLSASIHTSGAWTTQAVAGASAASGPAVAPLGAGFVAAFRAAGDALSTTSSTGTTWGTPTRVGTASARSTPALAITGTTAHLAFQDTSFLYMYSALTGAAWDAPSAVGAPQSFGFEAPALGAVGTTVIAGFGGSSEGPLYLQERAGAAWGAAASVTGTAVCGTDGGGGVSRCGGAPALLATGGATADLLTVHIDRATRLLTSTTRAATTKAVTVHGPVGTGVTSDEEVFLAKAGPTRAVLTFRGQDGKGYAALADLSGATPAWSAPVALSSGTLASVPRVAAGVCGDDAIATFVLTGGAVKILRLRGTTWGSEEAVGSAPAARFAAIATRP